MTQTNQTYIKEKVRKFKNKYDDLHEMDNLYPHYNDIVLFLTQALSDAITYGEELKEKTIKKRVLQEVLTKVIENGSSDREWVIKYLTREVSKITGVNLPIPNEAYIELKKEYDLYIKDQKTLHNVNPPFGIVFTFEGFWQWLMEKYE